MSLIGAKTIIADDIPSTLWNVPFALDVLADIVQTKFGSLLVRCKHVREITVFDDH